LSTSASGVPFKSAVVQIEVITSRSPVERSPTENAIRPSLSRAASGSASAVFRVNSAPILWPAASNRCARARLTYWSVQVARKPPSASATTLGESCPPAVVVWTRMLEATAWPVLDRIDARMSLSGAPHTTTKPSPRSAATSGSYSNPEPSAPGTAPPAASTTGVPAAVKMPYLMSGGPPDFSS
jgi:hypothetical protein